MSSSQNVIEEIRYLSPHSILVIGNKGLRRLFCPFQVQSLKGNHESGQNTIFWVEEVRASSELRLLFIINKVSYRYSDFIILI